MMNDTLFMKVTQAPKHGHLPSRTYYIPAEAIRYVYHDLENLTVLVLEDGTKVMTHDCIAEDVVKNVLCGEIIPLTDAKNNE